MSDVERIPGDGRQIQELTTDDGASRYGEGWSGPSKLHAHMLTKAMRSLQKRRGEVELLVQMGASHRSLLHGEEE